MRIMKIALCGAVLMSAMALVGCCHRVEIRENPKPTQPTPQKALATEQVSQIDNSNSDEDEYGRPRNKQRRHLFPRLRK
jgi:hypothetical protein